MNNEETRQIIKETALGITKYRVDCFAKKGLKCAKFFDEAGNLRTDLQKTKTLSLDPGINSTWDDHFDLGFLFERLRRNIVLQFLILHDTKFHWHGSDLRWRRSNSKSFRIEKAERRSSKESSFALSRFNDCKAGKALVDILYFKCLVEFFVFPCFKTIVEFLRLTFFVFLLVKPGWRVQRLEEQFTSWTFFCDVFPDVGRVSFILSSFVESNFECKSLHFCSDLLLL